MKNEPTRPSVVSRASDAGHRFWQDVGPRIRRHPRLWAAGALVVVAVLFMVFKSPAQPQQGGGGRFGGGGPQPVATATAEKGDIPVTQNALGTITPLATVTVRSQISGVLTQVAFKEGQFVHDGDLLALVDPRPYQHALEQAEGALQRDQALLKNAVLDAARYKLLFQQDSIAKQQLDTQDALVLQYRGTVLTDQGQVESAKLNLNYCYVKAPVNGRVGLRLVDQGNYVSVGDATGIAVITQMQPITAIFTLPEDTLGPVLQRLRRGVTLTVTAYDRGVKNKLADGAVTTIDNQIDTTTGTVKLRAQFANQDEFLFPNQFVNISLLVDTIHDAVVIPTSAVQRGAPGTFVYLVNPVDKDAAERARQQQTWWRRMLFKLKSMFSSSADGSGPQGGRGHGRGNRAGGGSADGPTVSIRPITLGQTSGERVAVDQGLAVGDVVVTDGADRLKDGAKVILPDEKKAGETNTAGKKDGTQNGAKAGADGQKGQDDTGGQPSGDQPHRHRHRANGDSGGGGNSSDSPPPSAAPPAGGSPP